MMASLGWVRAGLFLSSLALLLSVLLSGAQASSAVACPLAGKCPYVTQHHQKSPGSSDPAKGCPLEKAGCSYFAKHKQDSTMADVVLEDSLKGCPMEKCPYYEVTPPSKNERVQQEEELRPL